VQFGIILVYTNLCIHPSFRCPQETATAAPNIAAFVFTLPSKTFWDTRAWFLGLFLGNFAGLLLLCGGNPNSRRFLESAFPYTALGYYTGDFIVAVGLVSGALIFPAILSCIAERFYALWGLVPICLLMLWIVAGSMAAHTVSSVFDPLWALPLVALLGWVIASVPISLFRFFRKRHRVLAVSTPFPTPKRLLSRWVGLLASITMILALLILGWYNLKHPIHFSVDMQVHWSSGKEARVPLIKHGTGLYVKAWLNDQEELCQIDTGASSVEWPRELHVKGR
jgi:hypothetical protein